MFITSLKLPPPQEIHRCAAVFITQEANVLETSKRPQSPVEKFKQQTKTHNSSMFL